MDLDKGHKIKAHDMTSSLCTLTDCDVCHDATFRVSQGYRTIIGFIEDCIFRDFITTIFCNIFVKAVSLYVLPLVSCMSILAEVSFLHL